ncbi:protein ALP1-like [Sitophilus oryzae]|uniref:Protein ALP1-like n=1 Tax=Sitophilus oryzae TaxID=7048 RepID=A0A6J2Y4U9_SITOR|nr:protein ALP1-like [Sitophilus oryzae]
MSATSFDKLLAIIGPNIKKGSNREPISPGCRLAITLRFLATGDSYPSLSYGFRVGVSTICEIIKETCCIIWNLLQPLQLPVLTKKEWKSISENFLSLWSLSNCVGAIDGKHIIMQAPSNTGSLFYNYKKSFSIILLAVCDAKYNFICVDIGAYGSHSDGGVLNNSSFGKKLLADDLDIPQSEELPNCPTKIKIPHFFVGDEAFPLKENLMRPYSKPREGSLARDERIFNYRLSRARKIIENTFGIMVARFRIFHRIINGNTETVDGIVKSAVCLYNFIRNEMNECENFLK